MTTTFKVSSFCGDQLTCVSVLVGKKEVLVQDTKTTKTLKFNKKEWNAFIKGVKAGEFDG